MPPYETVVQSIRVSRKTMAYYVGTASGDALMVIDLVDTGGQAVLAWLDMQRAIQHAEQRDGVVYPAHLGDLADAAHDLLGMGVFVITAENEHFVYRQGRPA